MDKLARHYKKIIDDILDLPRGTSGRIIIDIDEEKQIIDAMNSTPSESGGEVQEANNDCQETCAYSNETCPHYNFKTQQCEF